MKTYLKVLAIAALFAGCSKSDSDYVNNPDIDDNLHNRSTGASANELLSSSVYTSLKIEVQYMTGFAPDQAALNHAQAMLAGIVNKPGGISIVTREIAASGDQTYTSAEILDIERKNRTVFTSGSQLGLYVLITNGNYTDNNVLGVAYRNTSIALMGKKIHDNSGGLGQTSRTKLEATVTEHEFGHLLGLVNIGSAMQTNHQANGSHCNNDNCLMHYASETSDILGLLITGSIPTLDANCRADLNANGGQ